MTPPLDVAALRALLEAGTPGPWSLDPCSNGGAILRRGQDSVRHMQSHLQVAPESDAELIVAAVNALSGLLDELDTLRAQMKRVTDVFVKDVDVRNGLRLELETGVSPIIGDGICRMLGDAENYVEMQVMASDKKMYILTAQRFAKPTPHELRRKAEAENTALLAELEGLRARDAEYCELADLLTEAAKDLESEIDTRYGYPDVHPSQRNKYNRDSETVTRLQKAADRARGEGR